MTKRFTTLAVISLFVVVLAAAQDSQNPPPGAPAGGVQGGVPGGVGPQPRMRPGQGPGPGMRERKPGPPDEMMRSHGPMGPGMGMGMPGKWWKSEHRGHRAASATDGKDLSGPAHAAH